jgi:hypothetical protein
MGTVVHFDDANLFPTGTDEVTLTVRLDSNDFYIPENTQELRVPHRGDSFNRTQFDISPKQNGSSKLKATVLKDRNFIQQIEYTFDVGNGTPDQVKVVTKGRLTSMTDSVTPRDMSIMIESDSGSYECLLVSSFATKAQLKITPAELANAVNVAHDEMLKVISHEREGTYVFQKKVNIAKEDEQFALKTMAMAGYRLFQKIFFASASCQDSRRIGNYLRQELSNTNNTYKLKVVAEGAPIPWGSLYVGDVSDEKRLCWDNFIGMRHMVDQKTLNSPDQVLGLTSIIPSKPKLFVGLNINEEIDSKMKAKHVDLQLKWWSKKVLTGHVKVIVRKNYSEIVKALKEKTTKDQILYFYCHATAGDLSPSSGPGAASLGLSDRSVTLSELEVDAPIQELLEGNPLVFINACKSSQLSPEFYDGFVPYFMGKGARGIVGTECQIPALFARKWADRFFTRLLNGQPVGEAFLDLRREFRDKHNNPLGLFYGIYCDGDTRIRPAPV